MILRRQHGHGARGLAQPVDLHEVATERRDRPDQHVQRDRRGAVGDRAQRRQVQVGDARHAEHRAQHGGHREQVRHPVLDHRAQDRVGVGLAQQHRVAARVEATERVAAAGDVEQRHGDQVHGVGPEVERLPAHPQQRQQVVLGQHHALRQAGGARGVKLDPHVVGLRTDSGIERGRGGDPLVVVLVAGRAADRDDLLDAGQVGLDRLDARRERRADDEDPGLRVGDDRGDLGRRQPPAHRDVHRPQLRPAEEQLVVLRGVGVEAGDPVAGADPLAGESLGHLVRAGVELGEGDGAAVGGERGLAAAPGAMGANQVGDGTDRHVIPRSSRRRPADRRSPAVLLSTHESKKHTSPGGPS